MEINWIDQARYMMFSVRFNCEWMEKFACNFSPQHCVWSPARRRRLRIWREIGLGIFVKVFSFERERDLQSCKSFYVNSNICQQSTRFSVIRRIVAIFRCTFFFSQLFISIQILYLQSSSRERDRHCKINEREKLKIDSGLRNLGINTVFVSDNISKVNAHLQLTKL